MFKTILQSYSQKVFSKYKLQVEDINALENKFRLFKDVELKEKTIHLLKVLITSRRDYYN